MFKLLANSLGLVVKKKINPKGITDKYIAPPIEGKVEEFYTEDAAKEIFDNLQTGNILSTGYKFLNMPSVDDMYASLLIRMGDI